MTLSEVTEPDTSSHNPVWHPFLLPWQILNCRLCKIRARDQVCSPLVSPSSGSLRHSTQDAGNPRTDSAQPATSARCLQILQGRRFATRRAENTQRFWNGLSLTNATDSLFFLSFVVCLFFSNFAAPFCTFLELLQKVFFEREFHLLIEELELDHSRFRTWWRMLSGQVDASHFRRRSSS